MAVIYLAACPDTTLPSSRSRRREVKNALAAYGGATKMQIREATRRVLGIGKVKSFHVADALAVALTVFYRSYRGKDDIVLGRGAEKNIRR